MGTRSTGTSNAARGRSTTRAVRPPDRGRRRRPANQAPPAPGFEVEYLPGLEHFVRCELEQTLGVLLDDQRIRFAGPPDRLLELRTAVAVHRLERFPGARPTVILGDQRLRAMLEAVTSLSSFSSFRVSAPGRDSASLHRVRQSIADITGLPENDADGDLLVRIRRREDAWEVLVRLTPRSLSARPWRVATMPGALHSTMAAAMLEMVQITRHDRVLNLCCGSGTLLAEATRGAMFVGLDTSPEALRAAATNLAAAPRPSGSHTVLVEGDATRLPFESASVQVVLADLPYGHAVGDHQTNRSLYPALFAEAARVAAPGARFAVVTQDLRLLERSLGDGWRIAERVKVQQRQARPTMYLLTRT